jgi:hypothetical protein
MEREGLQPDADEDEDIYYYMLYHVPRRVGWADGVIQDRDGTWDSTAAPGSTLAERDPNRYPQVVGEAGTVRSCFTKLVR